MIICTTFKYFSIFAVDELLYILLINIYNKQTAVSFIKDIKLVKFVCVFIKEMGLKSNPLIFNEVV